MPTPRTNGPANSGLIVTGPETWRASYGGGAGRAYASEYVVVARFYSRDK